jgi:hypothetical protein
LAIKGQGGGGGSHLAVKLVVGGKGCDEVGGGWDRMLGITDREVIDFKTHLVF